MGTVSGEMRERLNRADSKSVVLFYSTEGSNPSLSAEWLDWSSGEMTEWPKVHAWKACVPYPGTEGSNPSLSVFSPLALIVRTCAIGFRPTPSGPGGSSGK